MNRKDKKPTNQNYIFCPKPNIQVWSLNNGWFLRLHDYTKEDRGG